MQHSPESSVKAPLNTSCVTASVRVTAVGGKPVPRRRPVPYPTGPCRSPGPVRSLCTLKLPASGTGPPSRLTIHAAATDPGPQPAPVAGPVGLSDPQLSHYHISRPCAAGPAPARGSRPSDISLPGPTPRGPSQCFHSRVHPPSCPGPGGSRRARSWLCAAKRCSCAMIRRAIE